MKSSKRKHHKADGGHVPASFAALAELTSSDVVEQVKAGMSRLAPLEGSEEFSDSAPR